MGERLVEIPISKALRKRIKAKRIRAATNKRSKKSKTKRTRRSKN